MTEPEKKDDSKGSRGGRKGGAIYPQYALDDVLPWARKLVSKSHVEAQSRDVIYSGVVGAKSGHGNVRISALKQFGLMEVVEDQYSATQLAKKILAAPEEELVSLYVTAALKPKIFSALHNTFHGDSVSRAKLRQRVADLGVHPEKMDDCVDQYISTLQTAKLATIDGDRVVHRSVQESFADIEDVQDTGERPQDEPPTEMPLLEQPSSLDERSETKSGRANINVTIALDSSLDTEKLEKQLSLLKRFGAL